MAGRKDGWLDGWTVGDIDAPYSNDKYYSHYFKVINLKLIADSSPCHMKYLCKEPVKIFFPGWGSLL